MRVNRGFTLVELAVVLFIMVLAFAAIGIRFSSGQGSAEINAAARDMVSALRYARGQALMTRAEISVLIDFAANTYHISHRDRIYHIPETIDVTLVTAQTETRGDGVAGIRFFPDSSSTGGRITLERGGFIKRIDINWLTGQVELADE